MLLYEPLKEMTVELDILETLIRYVYRKYIRQVRAVLPESALERLLK